MLILLWSALLAFAADCGPDFKHIQPSWPALPALTELVRKTGLSEQQLATLGPNVTRADAFVKNRRALGAGFLLAKDKMNGAAEFFSSARGLKHWTDGYEEMGLKKRVRTPGHVEEYMTKITASGKPVVFLVPPDIMRHQGITRAELDWLLAHPQRLKNVHFVFGAYDLLSPELLDRYNRTHDSGPIRELLGPN